MAARKPKNPFNDLADLVKSQMYGSKPTTVSTQKKIKDVGNLVKTVDTFATGGLGRAVVADSKAQARGANVPVNLATYGVTSLAAGAVGAVVAKGAVGVAKTVAQRNTLPALAKKIDKVQNVVKKTGLTQEMGGYNLSTLKGRAQQALNDVRFSRADQKLSQLSMQQSNRLNRAMNVSTQKSGDLSPKNLSSDLYERAKQVEDIMRKRGVKTPKKK